MSKQILISQELFTQLVRYHCLEFQDDELMNQNIKEQLESKLNKMCNRLEYSKRFKDTVE